MGRRRWHLVTGSALLLPFLAGMLVTAPGAAAATARADLVTRTLVSPTTARTGSTLTVRITLANTGRKAAKATTTRLTLASVGLTPAVRIRGTARTRPLTRHRRGQVTVRLRAPLPGRYTLTACADAHRRIAEKSERNNCRTRTLVITARPNTVGSPPPSTPPTTPPVTPTGLLAPPAPLDVHPTATSATPRTAIVTPLDSSVTIPLFPAGAASVGFTFPGQAVLERVHLSAQPVSVSGHPFSSVLGAALVTPDVLSVEAFDAQFVFPDTVDVATLVAFTADADGTDLRLAPLDIARFPFGKRVFVRLMHGGIVGVATATATQVETLTRAWPRDADQQVEASLSRHLLEVWRATWTAADTASALSAFSAAALSAQARVVTPALAALAATTPFDSVTAADRLSRNWQMLVSDAYKDDDTAIPPELDSRFDSIDETRKQAVRDLSQRAQDGNCGGVMGTAQIRLVVGAARTLRNQGDAAAADLVMTGSQIGFACSYLLLSVTQDWTVHQTGSAPYDEAGSLVAHNYATNWGVDGWSAASSDLAWSLYSLSRTQPCQSGQFITSGAPGAAGRVGVTFGSYGLTPLRGGGFTPLTALVRLYAATTDPVGTVAKPQVTLTHSGGCDGLTDSTASAPVDDPPFSDPEAIPPGDRAGQGWGGEFTLTGTSTMTHDFTLTSTVLASGGGTREISEHFSLTLQPT